MLEQLPEPASVGSDLDRLLDRAMLRQTIGELPAGHADVLLLVDGEGLSYGEAAEVLSISPGTVASRLSRARITLRAAITDHLKGGEHV